MSSPFVAEIRMFAGNFAPTGWSTCDGQILPISQNTALFSLLGTFYGGDGKSTFALPNLQGSSPIHQGQGQGLSERYLGETGGAQTVTLIQSEMPMHVHQVSASTATGTEAAPADADSQHSWGLASGARGQRMYAAGPGNTQMGPNAFSVAGSSFPHDNMHPYLCLTFIIALQGVFPPRP